MIQVVSDITAHYDVVVKSNVTQLCDVAFLLCVARQSDESRFRRINIADGFICTVPCRNSYLKERWRWTVSATECGELSTGLQRPATKSFCIRLRLVHACEGEFWSDVGKTNRLESESIKDMWLSLSVKEPRSDKTCKCRDHLRLFHIQRKLRHRLQKCSSCNVLFIWGSFTPNESEKYQRKMTKL